MTLPDAVFFDALKVKNNHGKIRLMPESMSIQADRGARTNKGNMDPASFETASRWATVAAALLSLLAAIAAMIAFYASSRLIASRNATLAQVRAESTMAIEAAQARSADAENAAASADASATAASDRLKALEATIHDAPLPAEQAPLEAPRPGTAASETQPREVAGITQRLVSEIPARSADAGVRPNRRQSMVSILKASALPPRIELSWVSATDAYALAKEIWGALEDAGWTVTPAGSVLTPSAPTGLSITTGLLSNDTLLLESAFEAVGLEPSIVLEPTVPADQIRLMIGTNVP